MRLSQLLSEFLSTPSGWRATVVLVALFPRCFNFYPRPPGGGRPFCISKDICVYNFYPRPPGGGRLSHSMFPRTAETISIHALRVEGDKIAPFVKHLHYISIHALRVEGDKSIFDRLRRRIRNFYPRPPGGGRRVLSKNLMLSTRLISIHALRVEGDKTFCSVLRVHFYISIHALRVEGDAANYAGECVADNFYPRPPGGGRQQKRTKFSSVFAKKGEEFASLRRGKRKICRWRFKKDKFWVLIWCEGSRKSVCALASHCG